LIPREVFAKFDDTLGRDQNIQQIRIIAPHRLFSYGSECVFVGCNLDFRPRASFQSDQPGDRIESLTHSSYQANDRTPNESLERMSRERPHRSPDESRPAARSRTEPIRESSISDKTRPFDPWDIDPNCFAHTTTSRALLQRDTLFYEGINGHL
jgi:hypothetical protein